MPFFFVFLITNNKSLKVLKFTIKPPNIIFNRLKYDIIRRIQKGVGKWKLLIIHSMKVLCEIAKLLIY